MTSALPTYGLVAMTTMCLTHTMNTTSEENVIPTGRTLMKGGGANIIIIIVSSLSQLLNGSSTVSQKVYYSMTVPGVPWYDSVKPTVRL